jgi:hypothetical protein
VIAKLVRAAGLFGLLLVASAPGASAANQKEIDKAIKGGSDFLKIRYIRGPGAGPVVVTDAAQGMGPTALAGLALLEAGVPANDPTVKLITDMIRDASYRQSKTYQTALCLMYLDRYGDPNDAPLIQMLAMRLIIGQTSAGGWTYDCCAAIPAADEQWLRANVKPAQLVAGAPGPGGGKNPPKLHPEVEKYGQALLQARVQPGGPANGLGDNSNTQFALLALWMARKYGAPVEDALDLVEKHFMATQNLRTGGWSYSVMPAGAPGGVMMQGSPSMYCAGLLGMATAVARRDERQKKDPPAPKPEAPAKPDSKPSDPFYHPPSGGAPPPKPGGARPADARDLVVQRAFAGLGLTIADQVRNGNGLLVAGVRQNGNSDTYFLWSLERVGVVYGMDKIGGVDWYDVGSTALVRSQGPDGSWNFGTYGAEVNTAFAILFLTKANLARDLSSKVQKDPTSTEMRAGAGPSATDLLPNRPTSTTLPPGSGSTSTPSPVSLPNPTGDASITLASNLLKATGSDWTKLLGEARDGKGPNFTRALVVTTQNADGDRRKEAREALAERLCRMTPATLRGMLKADDMELRRAAALACAMKDDKDHIPDLIAALEDNDDAVVRAAKAGLKSLSGKDFGPPAGASAAQRTQAISAWKAWYTKQK